MWCWHVSDTKDNDKDEYFTLQFKLTPVYGFMYRHATWGAEGHIKEAPNLLLEGKTGTLSECIYLENIIDRSLYGIIEFESTSKEYIDNVVLTSGSKKIVGEMPQEKGALQRFQVPVGKWKITYDKIDGDDNEFLGTYVISNIDVQAASKVIVPSYKGVKQ